MTSSSAAGNKRRGACRPCRPHAGSFCRFYRKAGSSLIAKASQSWTTLGPKAVGVLLLLSYMVAIKEFPSPSNIKELQAFQGMVNFYI
jgi:hypothetical protein